MVLRYHKEPSQRQLQVSEEIRRAISEVFIRNELSDPFFDKVMVTVSVVRISQDLKIATVFLALPKEADPKPILKALNEIAKPIRSLMIKKIKLRFSPELRFVIDESFKSGDEVDSILSKLT
jgi:ribosome-binding factor A